MNKKKRLSILYSLEKKCYFPMSELQYSTNFQLLIATILSARSTDLKVNKVTKRLFLLAPSPLELYLLGEKKIMEIIQSLGLYKKKTQYIYKVSKIILYKHANDIPNTRSKLLKLPGVGRKTANIILNKIFQKNTIAVDTHVFRVCNRTNFVSGKTYKIVELKLKRMVPWKFQSRFHDWLVLHGRYVCKSINPQCNLCILKKYCEYSKKYK
ncbi:endonuclease III [Buchnera aphidicola]|uniref:Endonuclease III n=1 Tax=Buchnera aphidicola subsp. Tuberolachnus salignus TaxID=98804 RepID=A0A160SYG5_BUCTT|nr:endonuclease III [Buchnera aphidicola]CUR53061.1 Endonuclease III [Buchnera aphidicola (Tuberolachnus salignus)]